MTYKVKIKVIKQFGPEDIIGEEFILPSGKPLPKCYLKEGREFEVGETGDMPEDFCHHAWYGIYKSVQFLKWGGKYTDWTGDDTIYGVCPDGIRPVIFKLDRIIEES